ncbi:OPT superfamily [Thecaphora frezii]
MASHRPSSPSSSSNSRLRLTPIQSRVDSIAIEMVSPPHMPQRRSGHAAASVLDGDSAGDDFTWRAVLAGLVIGCLLAFTNLYLGLQSGWVSLMSLQSALLGFAIFKLLPKQLSLAGRRFYRMTTPLTPAENVLVQTTAAAVGIMPLSAGLVGVIPALAKLTPEKDASPPIVLEWLPLLGWCFALAYFGVFFASPLREPMIIREKLAFPSGTATAQLISVLHKTPLLADRVAATTSIQTSRGRPRLSDESSRLLDEGQAWAPSEEDEVFKGDEGWTALTWSFAASATFTILSYFIPVLYAMPLFDPFTPSHDLAAMWGWWFTPSLSYVGQGIIMGLPTTISMTAGALIGWGVLSPLAHYYGWAPGHPLDSEDGSKGWILWISLAIMCSESIVGLIALVGANGLSDLKQWRSRQDRGETSYSRLNTEDEDPTDGDHAGARRQPDTSDREHEPAHRLTPSSWVSWGLIGSTAVAVVLIWLDFGSEGISPWATCVGIVLASIFAILGVRALGETDLNPVSGIGKISQLLFAVLQPNNVVANVVAGGIAEAGAAQAGDLMQDYKTGHLVGASPRAQFKGQLIGSTLGIFVSCFAYKLYTSAYEIPGPQFPAPTAAVWLNLARLVNQGHLPTRAGTFMVLFGGVFAMTGVLKTLLRIRALRQEKSGVRTPASRLSKLVPSGIAFAVGMLNTPNFSLARLLGGVVAHLYARRLARQRPNSASPLAGIFIIIVASGFVLGEGAASIVSLLLKQHSAEPWTCFGCRGGCSGGCA